MDSKKIQDKQNILNFMFSDTYQETQVSLKFSDYMKILKSETSKIDVKEIINTIRKIHDLKEENIIEIARFCASNQPIGTLDNFDKFDIKNPEKKHEIIKICMQSKFISVGNCFRYIDLIDENNLFEIVNIFAKKNPEATAKYFDRFKLSDPQEKLEIAFECARQSEESIINYWNNFQINDQINKYEFIKLCAQKNNSNVLDQLDNLKINSIDQKIEIFKLCAKKNVPSVLKNFYQLKDASEDERFEIVKICAKNNPGTTTYFLKDFGIINFAKKDKILKICMHKNINAVIHDFKKFKIDDPISALEIAKYFVLNKNLEKKGLILEDFLYEFCNYYPKENLDILILDKEFYGFNFSSNHNQHKLYNSLANFLKSNLKSSELEAMNICLNLVPELLREDDASQAIELLSSCAKKLLPFCIGGNTQAEKESARENLFFFDKHLTSFKKFYESESVEDQDEDFDSEMNTSLLYMSNLFSNLILNKVSAKDVNHLQPVIQTILTSLEYLDGNFLNAMLCKRPIAMPSSWINSFDSESELDQGFQILASFLLYKLDTNNQANLQATVETSAARDALKNTATIERFIDFVRTIELLPRNYESQKVAILKRLNLSAQKRTDIEITALKQEYKNDKLKQSLAEHLGNQLQGNNLINLQKNLYYQVFQRCLINIPTSPGINRKALDKIVNAQKKSFTFENFQKKFSPDILKTILSSKEITPSDLLLLTRLKKFMQEELESELKGAITEKLITPEQISLSVNQQFSEWFDKVTGANEDERRKHFNQGIDLRRDGIAIRNLMTEFSLFTTLINLGGTLALEDFLKVPDQSLPDFLYEIIQAELSLNQSFDVFKFFEVMATWRDPNAILTYAGRIINFAEAQKGLGEFLISLVNNNFIEQRYANIGLDNIFSNLRSTFNEKWCDKALFEQPLTSALAAQNASSPGLEIPLQQTCFSLFKDNLSIHGHLGYSAEILWKEFPLFAKYFYGSSSASQNINGLLQQALQDSEDFPENQKKNQFQTALIQLIEQPDNYDLLGKAQDALEALNINCELKHDLSSWKQTLESRKQISTMNFVGYKVMVTDDPQLLFSMGRDVPGSCQSYLGIPNLCRGLIGTVWDPKAKLVAITDAKGKIIGRNVIRLALNASDQPILLLEKQYPTILPSPELKQVLSDQAIAYARMLGCDLVTTEKSIGAKPLDSKLNLGNRRYAAYLDSIGGNSLGTDISTSVEAWYLAEHKQLVSHNERV